MNKGIDWNSAPEGANFLLKLKGLGSIWSKTNETKVSVGTDFPVMIPVEKSYQRTDKVTNVKVFGNHYKINADMTYDEVIEFLVLNEVISKVQQKQPKPILVWWEKELCSV